MMSINMNIKTILGYFLIFFALLFMIVIALPQFYSNSSSGRINKNVVLEFDFLKEEKAPVVMLFFGYVGCGDICIPAMNELSTIYEQLDKSTTKVYFVNVFDETNKEHPLEYAKAYNSEFMGIYLDKLGIKKVSEKLTLAIIKISQQEISHTGHLYILEKDELSSKYYLKYIYTTRPFDEKSIVKDINILIGNKA